ncbi:MAG: hypothetical protein CMH22_05800 [Methylophaga sp.]|nr:hypothetical protein [Methylophaga sp.]|tara:strand:+ start:86395 stop:86643 length:249 start_codon:yes stop_codon:yes gene_type:complete
MYRTTVEVDVDLDEFRDEDVIEYARENLNLYTEEDAIEEFGYKPSEEENLSIIQADLLERFKTILYFAEPKDIEEFLMKYEY